MDLVSSLKLKHTKLSTVNEIWKIVMGSGSSKDQNGGPTEEEEDIDTTEFEPIKNWQGEVSKYKVRTRNKQKCLFLKQEIHQLRSRA